MTTTLLVAFLALGLGLALLSGIAAGWAWWRMRDGRRADAARAEARIAAPKADITALGGWRAYVARGA